MNTSSSKKPSREQLSVSIDLYRRMQLIRLCEERLAKAHQQGLVHGACHTYVGQEAIAAGVCSQLEARDMIFSTHRGHGHALAKGLEPGQLFAELYGRETGCSRGRGGSMHLFAPEVGMMGTSGIVGPCILQATGAGYSFKLLKTKHVAVAFFGDGAVNNGAFHEGLNLASIWKLPVLFVCENNRFATEVHFAYAAANPSVASRGASYNMPAQAVDGNDALAVMEAAKEAVNRARSGGGPTLLECNTYRTRPHSEGMGDFTYRTREEVEEWKSKCPIKRLRTHLLENQLATEADLEKIDQEIARQAEAAHQFAEKSPEPSRESAALHIFADTTSQPGTDQASGSPVAPSTTGRQLTFMKATLEALTERFSQDPTIFVLGEGIGKRGGNFATTTGLYDIYGPERLCDTPICERGFVGLACGAAMSGTRPVVDFMFADFVLDAVGEIINQIAKIQYMSSGRIKMPVLLRGCIGIGHSAATHHSGSYYSMYANFPGLRVVVPSSPHDAKGLLKTALTCNDPVLFLEHRELMSIKGPVPEGDYAIEFGQASIVRSGRHVTVVALALMVHKTLQACETLEKEGISVELIDPRTVAPLDTETILQSVSKTGRLLIVDEAFSPCGVGAEIAAQLADRGFDELDAPIRRLNGIHTPTPYSPALESAVVPDVNAIAQAIRDLVNE
ncbi:MAG: dehydrogenase E1 component subunit alpha/beta [Verrucomicrobiales bacterium]|nr:dehydrogenase E1 component subunit alpha/beta [Verrucomicrobiales bacterium]